MKLEIIQYICKCIVICIGIYSLSMCVAKIDTTQHIYLEAKTAGDCVTINLNGESNVSPSK